MVSRSWGDWWVGEKEGAGVVIKGEHERSLW